DLDTTSSQNSYIDILNAFRTGKAQVLIGTQMIAKGLDFPRVTLVGAIMADMTLDLPDYRSPERTYQLLVQVAGRAGRAGEEGNVIIQSYKPEHYAVASALKQDYRQFFNEEFARRKKDLYPPFTCMIRMLCEADNALAASQTAMKLKEEIDQFVEEDPVLKRRLLFIKCDKSPIGRIQNKYRMQVLMKILVHPDSERLKAFCAELPLRTWPCSVYYELNPSSMA
ncbi:MAG: primosomal protein N', partial [Clostridiales bacterium]|nr:primosomal protein N' [Clostridiales bacterium]